MTIKVKNSQDNYKYPLDYNQLLLRGTTLKSTAWIYGIVVYSGRETKIHMHQSKVLKTKMKVSRVEELMNDLLFYLFFI